MDSINNENLTISMIENCKPTELIKIGKRFQIQKFKDMCDLKQNIILNIMRIKGAVIDTEFYTEDFMWKKRITLREDKLRKSYLAEYLVNIELIYKQMHKLDKVRWISGIDIIEKDDPLKLRIMNEFVNVEEEFQKKKQQVQKPPNCALLICGDSGAGKSSFINLLVSKPLLPVSIRSNTSCQVKLTYGIEEKAIIIDRNENKIIIQKENFSTELKKHLESLVVREVSCKSATIFLDSPILKGGMDIYDTIGLGESEIFNEDLTKDLTDITGILFLLKKNNPIGDNCTGGLSKVINSLGTNGIPGSSMHFIINMCDQLDRSSEKSQLKKNVVEQIRDKCGGLNPEITTFSTKQELFLQSNNFMSKDYENIMTLIQNLHINSINTNTVSTFEFLFRFVLKSIDYIIESESFTEDDKMKKKEYINKLRNLEEDRKLLNISFKKETNKFLKNKYDTYRRQITNHFYESNSKSNVVNDVISKQTELFGMTDNDQIDKEIIELTHKAILKDFKEFVENEKLLKNCCEKMIQLFLRQYAEHQKKKDLFNEAMNSHIKSAMINIDATLTMKNFNDLLGLPSHQRKVLTLFAPIIIPAIEIKNIVKSGMESWFSFIISRMNLTNVRNFYEDTANYVKNRSVSYYTKFFSKNRNIKMIMDGLFYAPSQVAKDFEKYLSDDMNYLAKNIDLLDEDMRKREKVIQTYKKIKETLENIEEKLCKFYLLHLQKDKYDIMYEQIDSDLNGKDGNSPVPIIHNRNRVVYSGHFRGTQITDSSILVYKNEDGKKWKDLYLEYLKHKEILKIGRVQNNFEILKCFMEIQFHILCSINEKSNLYPMFLVNGIDYSLKKYIDTVRPNLNSDEEKYTEICRLLKQILDGLAHLHSQKPPLNHYDLTLDSIGYNTTYRAIKLSSISLETKVVIDNKSESQDYLDKVSHLPIEILEENSKILYTFKTDIYCLGTILYYLWVGILPLYEIIYDNPLNTMDQLVQHLKQNKIYEITRNKYFETSTAKTIWNWCYSCWRNKVTVKEMYYDLKKQPCSINKTFG